MKDWAKVEWIENKSTDELLGGDVPSDALYPSQAAVKEYIDTAISGVSLSGSTGGEHNSLLGLQGGAAGEYYHLTSSDYSNVLGAVSENGFQNLWIGKTAGDNMPTWTEDEYTAQYIIPGSSLRLAILYHDYYMYVGFAPHLADTNNPHNVTAAQAGSPALVSPSVDGNFVGFNGVGGAQKDSGSKAADFAVAAKGVTNGDSHDHNGGDGAAITEAAITLSDNTTINVSSGAHGLAPKLPNDATKFLDGTGAYDTVKEADIAGTAWTAFTPSWTNLTVGSGTNQGYYKQIGKKIFYRVRFVFAADSSVSGSIQLAHPVTITNYVTSTPVGLCNFVDDNGSTYTGQHVSATQIRCFNAAGTYLTQVATSATVPFTWATNDSITVQGFYEAA